MAWMHSCDFYGLTDALQAQHMADKVKTEDDFSKICCCADLQLSNLGLDPAYDPRVKTQMLLYVMSRPYFLTWKPFSSLGSLLPCCSIFCFFWSFQSRSFFQYNFNFTISRHLWVLLDDLHPGVVVPSVSCFLLKNTTSANLLPARTVRRAGLDFDGLVTHIMREAPLPFDPSSSRCKVHVRWFLCWCGPWESWKRFAQWWWWQRTWTWTELKSHFTLLVLLLFYYYGAFHFGWKVQVQMCMAMFVSAGCAGVSYELGRLDWGHR